MGIVINNKWVKPIVNNKKITAVYADRECMFDESTWVKETRGYNEWYYSDDYVIDNFTNNYIIEDGVMKWVIYNDSILFLNILNPRAQRNVYAYLTLYNRNNNQQKIYAQVTGWQQKNIGYVGKINYELTDVEDESNIAVMEVYYDGNNKITSIKLINLTELYNVEKIELRLFDNFYLN